MTSEYQVFTLAVAEREQLERVYGDLLALSSVDVPSVWSAARAALAQIAQALNGQDIAFRLYTGDLPE